MLFWGVAFVVAPHLLCFFLNLSTGVSICFFIVPHFLYSSFCCLVFHGEIKSRITYIAHAVNCISTKKFLQ